MIPSPLEKRDQRIIPDQNRGMQEDKPGTPRLNSNVLLYAD